MSISEEQVRHVATLARIALSDDSVSELQAQLSAILEHVDALSKLDLKDVEPTAHAVAVTNVTRADEVRPGLSRADALLNAPEQQDGAFLIPKFGGEPQP
jgi:aspartyl-tRNA(Asn)/glutamyl-tRNA(Gln) amidotransferase subunit C